MWLTTPQILSGHDLSQPRPLSHNYLPTLYNRMAIFQRVRLYRPTLPTVLCSIYIIIRSTPDVITRVLRVNVCSTTKSTTSS
jgi:hypothetical protein